MIRLIFSLLLLALAIASPARADFSTMTFQFQGHRRDASFYVPDGLTGPAPLILVVHGVLESGHSFRAISERRFEALADQFGYVLAYPSAYQLVWDLGEGIGAERLFPRRDDLAYLKQVISMAEARADIDPNQIFAIGYSQGGMMSFALACKNPGLIRAMGAVSMGLPELFRDDCTGNLPDGLLLAHGTDDPIVPFDGGLVLSGPWAQTPLMSFEATQDFAVRQKHCSAPTLIRDYDNEDDHTLVKRQLWTNCIAGTAVESLRIDGGGHRWPGGWKISPKTPYLGPATQEVDGAAMAFSFFSRFR